MLTVHCPHADTSRLEPMPAGCKAGAGLARFGCTHPGQPKGPRVTMRECAVCPVFDGRRVELPPTERRRVDPNKLILHNGLSPGDILVMSAAIAALHRDYPGRWTTAVDSPCPEIYEHNPLVVPLEKTDGSWRFIETHYPAIDDSDHAHRHFMDAYCDFLGQKLGVPLSLRCPSWLPKERRDAWVSKPYLYLSEEEKAAHPMEELLGQRVPYWVVAAGTKDDLTAKGWGHANYQRVVDLLRGRAQFVQVGEQHHLHKPLSGVIDLLGQTDTRQLIRLCFHADGGLGPSTFIQHIFAAWQRPYVCLLGGREPLSWCSYPTQVTMASHGQLPCCRIKACWKSRTVALGDGKEQERSLCELPVMLEEPVPKCLAMIEPERVVRAIEDCT